MTLDTELNVPEYKTKLYYHSSRRPTVEAVKKICESLELAREIVADAEKKIPYALTDPRLHQTLKQRWEDDSIPDVKAAKQAVLYHFHKEIPQYNSNLAPPGPQENWEGLFDQECKTINDVIYDILDGLNGLRGYLTLSDVLSQSRWDLYKVYGDGQSWDKAREELFGEFRPQSKGQPTADKPRSGYVAVRDLALRNLKSSSFGDGWVVTISDDNRSAQVWDTATGKRIGKPMQHARVCKAQFSLDGHRVVTISDDNTVRVWEAATGQAIGKPMQHRSSVKSARFSPDAQRMVTASEDKTAQVWNAETGEAVGEPMQHKGTVYEAQFSPDGQRVVTASADSTVRVWEASTGQAIGKAMQHSGPVYSARFSQDGQRVVTASADSTARVWEAATGQAIGKPMQHGGSVKSAQFSPEGQRVVTAAEETVRVWDAATGQAIGQPMRLYDDENFFSAQFTSDGQRVVTESEFNTMQYWDAATGEAIGEPMEADEAHFFGGIHIEFSNVLKYPRLLLALVIVHEATHKFADTEDHAYTDEDKYKKLTIAQRIENADSFAYVVISIALNRLIEDLEQFLKVVPRNDTRGPTTIRNFPADLFAHEERRARVSRSDDS